MENNSHKEETIRFISKKSQINKLNKPRRQTLIKQCDDIFRKMIHVRDSETCQVTGRHTNLQVAHFYTRGNLRLRWDLDNACLLQAGTHKFWAHKYPDKFERFWRARLGEDKFQALEIKARYSAPVRTSDLEIIKLYLETSFIKITPKQWAAL